MTNNPLFDVREYNDLRIVVKTYFQKMEEKLFFQVSQTKCAETF